MLTAKTKGLVEVYTAALLLGLVGLIVKTLEVSVLTIAFYRSVFAALSLALILFFTREPFRLTRRRDYWVLALLGLFQAIQWLTFFKAIQVSTVAVALISLFTFPLFVTLSEPIFFKEKIESKNIIASLVILFGIAFMVLDGSSNNYMLEGVAWGSLSSMMIA